LAYYSRDFKVLNNKWQAFLGIGLAIFKIVAVRLVGLVSFILSSSALGTPAFAQPTEPLQISVSKKLLVDKILPAVINKLEPVIQEKLAAKLAEINAGFEREQKIEYPLYDLIEAQIPEIRKFFKLYSSEFQDWEDFLNRLRLIRLQATFTLRIRPEAESIEAEFMAPFQPRSLMGFEGRVVAAPQIELLSVSDLRLIEVDPKTGAQKSVEMSSHLKKILSDSTRFEFPVSEFSIKGSVTDTRGEDPILIELQSWQSSFKDALITEDQTRPLIKALIQEKTIFEGLNALMSLEAFKKAKSTAERDLKAFLDEQIVDLIIWVEKVDGEYKPHLSLADKPETKMRMQKARDEKRLVFEAHTSIPLLGRDLKIDFDHETRIAKLEFIPLPLMSERFELKSLHLQDEWKGEITEPTINALVELLYGRNLFENQSLFVTPELEIPKGTFEIQVPLEWEQDAPRILSESSKTLLSALDYAEFKNFKFDWGTAESFNLDLRSKKPWDIQVTDQLIPILNAHKEILGDEFLSGIAKKELLRSAETQALALTHTKKATKGSPISYDLNITSLALVQEGDMSCTYVKGNAKVDPNQALQGTFLLPDSAPKDVEFILAPSLLEIECQVKLPQKIGIALSKVRSPQGSVGNIRFDLKTRDDSNPTVKMKWRLVRDPSSNLLAMIPVSTDWTAALNAYDIPLTGAGAPEIENILPNPGTIKGALASKVHLGTAIWNHVFRPKLDSAPNEMFLFNIGSMAVTTLADGYVRKLERREVEDILRASVLDAKASLQRDVTSELFTLFNGNIGDKRKLAKMRAQFGDFFYIDPQFLIDPQTVDRGLLGAAEDRMKEGIKKFREIVPLDKPTGQFPTTPTHELKAIATMEVNKTVQQTLEGDPSGLTPISDRVSNKQMRAGTQRLQEKVSTYLQEVISRNYKKIEDAVIDFIRFRSTPDAQSPLEALQFFINEEFKNAANRQIELSSNSIQLPTICGFSVASGSDDKLGDVYTVVANVENLSGKQPLRIPSPSISPRFSDFLRAVDADGGFPVGISTDTFEQVANNPKNIKAIEDGIVQEAQKSFGVSENLSVQIRDVRVRMTKEGSPVVRLKLKVDQPARGAEGLLEILGFIPDAVTGLLTGGHFKPIKQIGWAIDRVSDLVVDPDGYMEMEVPFKVSLGDVHFQQSDQIKGHYIFVTTQANSTKILNSKGWGSLAGGVAKAEVLDKSSSIVQSVHIPPIRIEGLEGVLSFRLGRGMQEDLDKPLQIGVPILRGAESDADNLYKGSFLFRILLDVSDEATVYPKIKASRPKP